MQNESFSFFLYQSNVSVQKNNLHLLKFILFVLLLVEVLLETMLPFSPYRTRPTSGNQDLVIFKIFHLSYPNVDNNIQKNIQTLLSGSP